MKLANYLLYQLITIFLRSHLHGRPMKYSPNLQCSARLARWTRTLKNPEPILFLLCDWECDFYQYLIVIFSGVLQLRVRFMAWLPPPSSLGGVIALVCCSWSLFLFSHTFCLFFFLTAFASFSHVRTKPTMSPSAVEGQTKSSNSSPDMVDGNTARGGKGCPPDSLK